MEDRWAAELRVDDLVLQPLYLHGVSAEDAPTIPADSPSKPSHIKINEREIGVDDSTRGWIPFYHRRSILLVLVALFICLIVTLAGLYGYSQTHQGVCNAHENLYYLWTYGPTAALTIVAACWSQVVYRTKQLMPWKAMLHHPQPVAKSLFLDYMSPIEPVAFYKAFKNGHYSVSLAVASSVVVTILTILSTGLFVLQYTDMVLDNVSLVLTSQFDLTNFDWSSVDARPATLVYAVTQLGLEYPSDTTAMYAIQGFGSASGDNLTLSSTVDTFSAYLDCESADLLATNVTIYNPSNFVHFGATFTMNLTSSSCTVTNLSFNKLYIFDADAPWNGTEDASWGLGQLVQCTEDNTYRLLVSVGWYSINQTWNGTQADVPEGGNGYYPSLVGSSDQIFRVINSSNIACVPRYQIQRSKVVKIVSTSSQNGIESIVVGEPKPDDQAVTATDIARGVFESINDSSAQEFSFFSLLQELGSNSTDWLDHDTLIEQSNALYASIAAQMAALKLLVPTEGVTVGSMTINQPRLFVRVLSFSLMEASLVFVTVVAVYLLFSASHAVINLDPGSVSGVAAILSKSRQLMHLMRNEGTTSAAEIQTKLQDGVFYMHSSQIDQIKNSIQVFHIDVEAFETATSDAMKTSDLLQWWQPRMLLLWSRMLVVLTPLIYIVVLEVMYYVSRSNGGLLAVDNSSWVHYGWTYIPALLMVCVHTMIVSVNFNVKILSPYSALQRGTVTPELSVTDHPLSRIALHDLFVFTKRRQLAPFAATMAALLAPLLTIVVSGLYTAEHYTQSTELRPLSGWNFNVSRTPNSTLLKNAFTDINQTKPGTNTMLTDLIVTTNFSYPAWSHDGFAFPIFEAIDDGDVNGKSMGTRVGQFDARLPALRGTLNCTIIAHDEVNVEYLTWNTTMSVANGQEPWNLAGNQHCVNYSAYPSEIGGGYNAGSLGCRLALLSANTTKAAGGCSIRPDVLFLPGNATSPQPFGYFSPIQGVNATHCPIYGGMVGTMTTDMIEDYTWFVCGGGAEHVMAQTTFSMPNYTILEVLADEDTAKPAKAYSTIGTAFEYNENLVGSYQYLTYYNVSDGQNFDNFFSVLVYGSQGVAIGDLLGEPNTSRMLSAIKHLWQVLSAQTFRTSPFFLSADQSDVETWWPQQQYNATYMDPNAYRLQQSLVSTRLLQGILAALSLCTITTFLLMDTRKVLPNNPCSIAIVASLLAGSEMLDVLARKNRTSVDKNGKSDEWAGYFFSLGWWERLGETRRFGIDIGKAEKAS